MFTAPFLIEFFLMWLIVIGSIYGAIQSFKVLWKKEEKGGPDND